MFSLVDKSSMENFVNLRLTNKVRARWLMPVLLIAMLGSPYFIGTWHHTLHRAGSCLLISIIYLILIAFFTFLSSEKAQVFIGESALTVHYLASGKNLELPFAIVKNHSIVSLKGGAAFTLEKFDGSTLKLEADFQSSRLLRIASKFDDAFYRYKYGHDKLQPIYSGPTFFRRRLASVILVAFAVSILAISLILSDYEGSKSFLLAIGYVSFIVYFIAWISARET